MFYNFTTFTGIVQLTANVAISRSLVPVRNSLIAYIACDDQRKYLANFVIATLQILFLSLYCIYVNLNIIDLICHNYLYCLFLFNTINYIDYYNLYTYEGLKVNFGSKEIL